jgi:pimeloyl-ACP methyl ester carboxylesterase
MIELREVRHAFTDANGLRLHRLEFGGDGRPILCLHGVTGHAWVWHDAAEHLRGVGRVVSLDMRGYGDSQWSADRAYTTDDHVADLEAVVSDLGLDSLNLAGSSWGGLVSLAFASRNAGLVHRLALVDVEPSSAQGETELFPRPKSFPSHAEAVAAERQANQHAPESMIEVLATMGTAPGPDGQLVRKHDPFFFERWPFRSDDRWNELRGLKMPVLVVHAEQSFIRAEMAERMVQEIAEARLVNVADSGHVIPVEQPAALGAALAEFFADG